jgi:hypothetical protein
MIRWSPAAPAHPSCPHRRLTRLLGIELGSGVTLGPSTLRPWASANFVGARHLFDCTAEGVSLDALGKRLNAAQWRLPGHIVADVAIEPGEDRAFRIEILTVED